MFQFSRFPSTLPIYSEAGNVALPTLGFPIRTFPDQSLMTALRDLSQSSTSFIGDIRQGILSVPLSTFLCIDLTGNCYEATTLPSIYIKNFLTSLIVKLHVLPLLLGKNTFEAIISLSSAWWTLSVLARLFYARFRASFTILSLVNNRCKDAFCCIFHLGCQRFSNRTFA